MTTLAHRTELGGPRNGGVAARRALVRWSVRLLRREWRQQLLVLTLLTVSVAAAIGSITVAYNAVPADDGDFGSANHLLNFDGSDPRKLDAGLESARKSFGTIDSSATARCGCPGPSRRSITGHKIPKAPTRRAPRAPPRQLPAGRNQVAVTDGVAEVSADWRSDRPWQSTGTAGGSWASSRTRAS